MTSQCNMILITDRAEDQTKAEAAAKAKPARELPPMWLCTSGPAGQCIAGAALLALGEMQNDEQNEGR